MLPTPVTEPAFLNVLQSDLLERRIQHGFELLESNKAAWSPFDPQQEKAEELVALLAKWVDAGFRDVEVIEEALARFPRGSRSSLPLLAYLRLRIAEGMAAMAREEREEALRHFDFILSLQDEIHDEDLIATAHFWTARCHRKNGEYEEALRHAATASSIADHLGHRPMSAVMRIAESWMHFQQGRMKQAALLLEEAESVLRDTDDYVSLGNIQSAYGRMARREARYEQALRHFQNAIEQYRKRDPQHRNLARSLVNMASVERMLSLEVKEKIDQEALQAKGRGLIASYRQRFEQLRRDAFFNHTAASEIYTVHSEHHGSGAVKVNCGYLHLDGGDLDLAAADADEAFELGRGKRDNILMARARLLQCVIENAKVEEGIETSDPSEHARSALEYVRDAVEFARHTENTRLLARCHIWSGLTLLSEFFSDAAGARAAADRAAALINADPKDPLWRELDGLRSRLTPGAGVNAALEAWSQGMTGDKTFQQITEEFAEVVIPKVWEQEDHKVARVAKRLSISPKKVRRILSRAGLVRH
jgi:tetratricopeptide (TPR) repeat protein